MKHHINNNHFIEFTLTEGTTCVAKLKNQRHYAFTLAEVLITLGIIGVVAAMTMPALISNHKKMVFKNQYKKLYSTIYQAYTKSVFDVGGVTDCYHTDINTGVHGKWSDKAACADFREAVEKNLLIGKICTTKAADNGCLQKDQYKGLDTLLTDNNPDVSDEELAENAKNCGGLNKNSINNTNLVYVLNDGAIIISYLKDSVPISMLLDVNGQKGPNKWGYDLFKMSFYKDGNNYKFAPIGCGVNSYEKGGISSTKMWQQMNN